jgi:hypothetical protein
MGARSDKHPGTRSSMREALHQLAELCDDAARVTDAPRLPTVPGRSFSGSGGFLFGNFPVSL